MQNNTTDDYRSCSARGTQPGLAHGDGMQRMVVALRSVGLP